jgi:hypothetical protein
VDLHGASDGADGSRANAVVLDGLGGGFAQFGVIAQAQVVIRGEVDDAVTVIGAGRSLGVVEDAEAEMGALCFEFVELGCEVLELGALGERSGRKIGCNSRS